jgi:hypothetical protein
VVPYIEQAYDTEINLDAEQRYQPRWASLIWKVANWIVHIRLI